MLKQISRYFLPLTILFISIGLACVAAYFSVTGLSKLFSGAATAVMVMASMLEAAKIATTAWLHNNWNNNINKTVKLWLVISVFFLLCLTSAGIYGYLSNSYFITSSKLSQVDTEVSLVEKQKAIYNSRIINYEKIKETKNNRIQSLTLLRIQQENRIDSLIKKGMNSAVKRTEIQIKDANKEINVLMGENDKMDDLIQIENSKISEIELKKAELNNSDVAAEVGPLKYIAKLTGKSMDVVINWFIMVIILVFDPLAIMLLIAANISLEKLKEPEMIVKTENKDIPIPAPEEKGGDINVDDEKIDEVIPEEKKDPIINEQLQQETKPSNTEEKENIAIELPTEIQNFFDEKIESEKEFKKRIEELNKKKEEVVVEKEIEIPEITNTFNIFPSEIKKSEEVEVVLKEEENIEIKQPEVITQEIIIPVIEEKQVEDTLYLKLLAVLLKDGNVKLGDAIPSYQEFINDLKATDIKYNETVIRDFLSACNLLKVIDTEMNKRIATKTYKEAREIIGKI